MTKRSKLTVSLATFCLALTLVGGFSSLTKGFTDFDIFHDEDVPALAATPVDNIRFLSVEDRLLEDGSMVKEILYEIEPASAQNETFNYLLDWNAQAGENKENDTWKNGKNAEDYVTYEVNSEESRISFTCKQAFGHQMTFLMTSISNPDIQASLTLDYNRRLVSPASIEVTSPEYAEGKAIQVQVTDEVYTVGTKGEKSRDLKPTITIAYKDSGKSYDSLFAPILTEGIHSKEYQYLDEDYDDPDELLAAMKANVQTYLTSLATEDGSKKFDVKTFRSYLTYSYYAYYTYKPIYNDTQESLNAFIKNYKEAYAQGSGFNLHVDAEGKASYDHLLELKLDVSTLTGLSFTSENITF